MRVTIMHHGCWKCITVIILSWEFYGKVSDCLLWHVKQQGKCECVSDFGVVLECDKDSLLVRDIFCLTWDNDRDSATAN